MQDDRASSSAGPKPWLVVLSALNFGLLLLGSLALAFCGLMGYTDSHSHEAEQWWGAVCMTVAGLLFLTSGAAVLFLGLRNHAAWIASTGFLFLTLVGTGILIVAGFGLVESAKRHGGDWAALAVLGSMLLGIVCPALVGLMALGGGACLFAIRRQIAARERLPLHPSD